MFKNWNQTIWKGYNIYNETGKQKIKAFKKNNTNVQQFKRLAFVLPGENRQMK
jgi:hypothetical protein